MKRNGTLVIVDMQPEFPAANNRLLLSAVIRKIRLAKMLNYGIVVVEYGRAEQYQEWSGGDTHLQVMKELEGYRHKTFVVKHVDDGSPQTIEAIEHYQFNRQHIYVCGVNTCCCVYATVSGLARRLPESVIYIHPDACRCRCDCNVRRHVTALRHQYNNVCLAPETRGEFDEYHRPKKVC